MAILALTFPVVSMAEEATPQEQFTYRPAVNGTLRTRWEMETGIGESRFQVRNARLSVKGKIAPVIDYFFNTDLCDRGKMKILDAWGRLQLANGLAIQAGQFRMPFGVDPFRGPDAYYFANRSFIGKQVCNVRAVGAKLTYTLPKVPLTFEAGAFNPTSISDHDTWNKSMAYAGKVVYRLGNVKIEAGAQTLSPDSVRVNLLEGCVSWSAGRWIVEGEYMNKHYTNSAHATCHAWNLFADYHFPVKLGFMNRMSVQCRYDGLMDHSSGVCDSETRLLYTTDPARNRVTLGSTLSYVHNNLHADIRVNYEKIFFHSGVQEPKGEGDKVVVELVIRF